MARDLSARGSSSGRWFAQKYSNAKLRSSRECAVLPRWISATIGRSDHETSFEILFYRVTAGRLEIATPYRANPDSVPCTHSPGITTIRGLFIRHQNPFLQTPRRFVEYGSLAYRRFVSVSRVGWRRTRFASNWQAMHVLGRDKGIVPSSSPKVSIILRLLSQFAVERNAVILLKSQGGRNFGERRLK